MSDFFQDGAIATLHRLGSPAIDRMEAALEGFSTHAPIALVLPCHARELGTPALHRIVRALVDVRYLRHVVVGIDGADAAAWSVARKLFGRLPQQTSLLWNDGPRIQRLLTKLARAGIDPGPPGKGRNLWLCFGQVLAATRAEMVAIHDCDISNYNREMLARLCFPVAHPKLGFHFCKGYSARFTDRLNGRVMRLLFTPLVRALQSILGANEFVDFLGAFRYPLSGEASLSRDLLRRIRVPSDWGVEAGMLAEVSSLCPPRGICQVDIAESYDHKHQDLSASNPESGLNKMAGDIALRVFRALADRGVILDAGLFDSVLATYMRKASDAMRFHAADAEINQLRHDRHEEDLAVATFARSLRRAARAYLSAPLEDPMIPSWNCIDAGLPGFSSALGSAVRQDQAERRRRARRA